MCHRYQNNVAWSTIESQYRGEPVADVAKTAIRVGVSTVLSQLQGRKRFIDENWQLFR
jgi:hypothetical protein